nr:phytase [Saprospiraceae bacterium]
MCKIYWTLLLCIGLASCTGSQAARNKEAREDAAKMAEARALQRLVPYELTVDAETTPVQSSSGEDAADDPAIWYNSTSPEKSIIIGTNKVAGLYTYDLDGNELHFSACGKVNNVDVRDGFLMGDRSIILVAASNRSSQTISLFELNGETGQLSNSLGEIKTHVDDVYGFTLYEDQGEFFAISNGKNGVIEVFQLQEANNTITGKLTQEFKVESQPEGMATIDN